jgi:hypothetical protein
MFQVFTIDECNEIINGNLTDYHVEKAKTQVIKYLESENIILSDPKYLTHMVSRSSTPGAKSWHYDDVSVINFITIIKGTGTKLLSDGKIEELQQGYGYMVIGEEGYKFLNLKPVLHCAPNSDNNRLLLKIFLDGSFNLSNLVFGPSVCSYDSPEYAIRAGKLDSMLDQDLNLVKSLI